MKSIVSVLIFVFSFGMAASGYTADSFVIESLRPQQSEYVNMALEHTRGAKVLKTATVLHIHPVSQIISVFYRRGKYKKQLAFR